MQGIVLCGRCGRRMHVNYSGPTRRPVYDCYPKIGTNACWNLPARPVDEAVAKLFLDVMKPPEIELGLALLHETGATGRRDRAPMAAPARPDPLRGAARRASL